MAAAQGNATAIYNLSGIVAADDSFSDEEKKCSLTALWAGIQSNKQETRSSAALLKRAGLQAPSPYNGYTNNAQT